METNNKAQTNSSTNSKTSAVSGEKRVAGKSALHSSNSGKFTGQSKTISAVSESDKLTLRAWKKTFENRKKIA